MAISISCPSCKQPFGLPESFTGGRPTCPNPKCGKTFYARAPQAAEAAPKPAASRLSGRGRTPPRPAAVSHIPPNMYASPGFVAGGGVVVVLYTLVLFAVLSGQRRETELMAGTPPEPEPPLVFPEPALPEVTKVKAPPASPPAPTKPAEPEKKAAETPKGKGTGNGTAKSEPKSETPATKELAPTVAAAEPASAPTPNAPPRPAETRKGKAAATDKAVALNTAPSKPAEPQPQPQPAPTLAGPTFNGLAPWVDPGNVAKARRDEGAIVVAIPPGPHILSPELKFRNAPVSLTEVTGDFEIQVRVAGGIRPGSNPLPEIAGLPIAFQGAGLLLWQDQDNYMRFERAAMSGPKQPLAQKVMVEVCRDGQTNNAASVYKDTSDRPVTLRLSRKGDELECAYSPDGKSWIVVKRSSIALFRDKVRVGISACNLSPKPFSARFEAFALDRAGGKSAAR